MDQAQFEALLSSVLSLGHELQYVEVKSAGRFDGSLRAKTIRAMLGMANRRDGGYIIIGVDDNSPGLEGAGISQENAQTWDHDRIADQLAKYADPSVRFARQEFEVADRRFVLLTVEEFNDVPIICKQNLSIDGQQVLKRGACYVRPRRKHETSEIATFEDMRELIDRATEKQLSRFERLRFIARISQEDDRNRFEQELSETALPELVDEIRSRGYWHIVVRPELFSESTIAEYSDLKGIIRNASVRLRGGQYPYASGGGNSSLIRQSNAYSESIRWDVRREYWQMFQSGQYVHWVAMWTDWLDSQERATSREVPQEWQPGSRLPIVDTILLFDAIFTFAERLALSLPEEESWAISIHGAGLRDRKLWEPNPERYLIPRSILMPPPIFDTSDYTWSATFNRTELIANYRVLASEAVSELFKSTEWDPGIETIAAIRDEAT